MTLLFVVDDGKTTAIIVEDRRACDELGPRRESRPGAGLLLLLLVVVLSRGASASQLDRDLIYNYNAPDRA